MGFRQWLGMMRASEICEKAEEARRREDYEEAKRLALEAMKRYNVEPAYELGIMYYCGQNFAARRSVPADYVQAKRWLLYAAEMGHLGAASLLAHLCTGAFEGVSKDIEKGIKYGKKALSKPKDHANGVYYLGLLYEDDNPETQDYKKAFSMYQLAAQHGYAVAYIKLARCCRLGYGTEKDEEKAYTYLMKAKEHKQDVNYELGMLFKYSKEKFFRPAEALECFLKCGESDTAAKKQYNGLLERAKPEVLLQMGRSFLDGESVPQRPDQAKKILEMALKRNVEGAEHWLNQYYLRYEPDHPFLAAYHDRMASQGDREAARKLGLNLVKNKQDYDRAITLLIPFAEAKDHECMEQLAWAYRCRGHNRKAADWYKALALRGDHNAFLTAVSLYRNSGDTDAQKDIEQLINHYTAEANRGSVEIMKLLEEHYRTGESFIRDERKSTDWCKQLADREKLAYYQCEMGLRYLAGYGIAKDQNAGMDYLLQAARNPVKDDRVQKTISEIWQDIVAYHVAGRNLSALRKWIEAFRLWDKSEHAQKAASCALWYQWIKEPPEKIWRKPVYPKEVERQFLAARAAERLGKNLYHAAELYRPAAEAGHIEAMRRLARICDSAKLKSEAEKWTSRLNQYEQPPLIAKAVEGDIEAISELAARYNLTGKRERNLEKRYLSLVLYDWVVVAYTHRAQAGDPESAYELYEIYNDFYNDEESARYWGEKAVEAGHVRMLAEAATNWDLPHYQSKQYAQQAWKGGIASAEYIVKLADIRMDQEQQWRMIQMQQHERDKYFANLEHELELDQFERMVNLKLYGDAHTVQERLWAGKVDQWDALEHSMFRSYLEERYQQKLDTMA